MAKVTKHRDGTSSLHVDDNEISLIRVALTVLANRWYERVSLDETLNSDERSNFRKSADDAMNLSAEIGSYYL